jgi:cytochrome P450
MVPSGMDCLIPIVNIHRNKMLWGDDADQFKPERFVEENIQKVHPYAYLPFSKGPRNCIGYKYAEKSLKVVLAHFMRSFVISTRTKVNEVEFEFTGSAKMAKGCNVSLSSRMFKSQVK